jgi:hypothetical protein
LVSYFKSLLRVSVRPASNARDHSSSVLVVGHPMQVSCPRTDEGSSHQVMNGTSTEVARRTNPSFLGHSPRVSVSGGTKIIRLIPHR